MKYFNLLCIFLMVSITLNIWQYLNSTSYEKVSVRTNNIDKKDKRNSPHLSGKKLSLKNISRKNQQNSKKRKSDNMKEPISDADLNSYEQTAEKTNKDIEQFIVNDLRLDSRVAFEVFQIIEESDKEFKRYIDSKMKALSLQYSERYGYMYDPHDYVFLGNGKLKARKSIRELIGDEQFELFMKFIQDYNHGMYAKSYVPISI